MSAAHEVLFDAPGPRARRRHALLSVVGLALVAAALWVALGRMADANQLQGYQWKGFVTEPVWWTAYLLPGLWGTIKAAALSVVFAGIFGIVFGMGRLSHLTWVRWVSGVVVEFFRAVPVLMMMLFLYFGYFATTELVSPQNAPLLSVVLALTLYNGAVIAELVRSGVFSLPAGQSEAGLSIGLTPTQTLRSIQVPQALTAMLPALVGQLVVVLKDSALGFAITYPDLLNQGKTLGSAYSNTLQAYLVVALLFILMNYVLTRLASEVEGRLKRRGGGRAAPGPTVDADGIAPPPQFQTTLM